MIRDILGFMGGVIFCVVLWAISEARNVEHWNKP